MYQPIERNFGSYDTIALLQRSNDILQSNGLDFSYLKDHTWQHTYYACIDLKEAPVKGYFRG